ncbi:MAG: hypothetical protein JOY66_06370, partial [Acetobacteraceae bacterium]|nr:hypothetical protein [Acetobacteraceae bacterium]
DQPHAQPLKAAKSCSQLLSSSNGPLCRVIQVHPGRINNVASFTSTHAQSFLTGTFANALTTISDQLNNYGAASNYVGSQISYNNDKIDALNSGLGSLIDADLAKESAQLQALQVRQQLGTQALSLANQAPQSLLSLFK